MGLNRPQRGGGEGVGGVRGVDDQCMAGYKFTEWRTQVCLWDLVMGYGKGIMLQQAVMVVRANIHLMESGRCPQQQTSSAGKSGV